MEREIILDTETTGFDPYSRDRVIEIGCVEVINRIPTGNHYHQYINPERDVPAEAFAVHGLSAEFLSDKPKFSEVADGFLDFVKDSKLIIHNSDFDIKFLNHHLGQLRKREFKPDQVFCTLKFARKKFPGQHNSLDALCKRFSIDNSNRTLHGALLDSEILAEVYLELMGGAQTTIDLNSEKKAKASEGNTKSLDKMVVKKANFESRIFDVSSEEIESHKKLIDSIPNSLWKKQS